MWDALMMLEELWQTADAWTAIHKHKKPQNIRGIECVQMIITPQPQNSEELKREHARWRYPKFASGSHHCPEIGCREADGFSRDPGRKARKQESKAISNRNEKARLVGVEGNLLTSWGEGREGGEENTVILLSRLRAPAPSWPDFSHRLCFLKVLPSPRSTWAAVQGLTHRSSQFLAGL